jgi:hypothetical protein
MTRFPGITAVDKAGQANAASFFLQTVKEKVLFILFSINGFVNLLNEDRSHSTEIPGSCR